jgi:putative FmdB family regulatory protein
MPNYDYRCPSCNELEEHKLPMEHEAPRCNKCGVPKDKQISVSNFILNGTGWARDNYGLKGK